MMGNDTIEQIREAYRALATSGARVLILDLRGNGGGAFAVKPLVEHLIDEPLDAGFFLSQLWHQRHARPPSPDELAAHQPWSGWSLAAFWTAVQNEELLRIRFEPATPNFDGPVLVLVDGASASATELAADALRASGVVTLIGEPTPGQMLSQSPFDIGKGYVVSLPVADYISVTHGRIEGAGVPVDLPAPSDEALDVALRRARQLLVETGSGSR